MTHIRFAAAVAAMLTVGLGLGRTALAESNNLAAVETPPSAQTLYGGGLAASGGSEAYPAFNAAGSVAIVAGADPFLPSNGSEGAVQTAASLPRGAMVGTVAYAQARSVARFLAERDGRARLVARQPVDARLKLHDRG